ncbi:hypothetical protein NL676_018334 [Syzygium grande]|nr:hypothetical protein NL676_018334 [Syzygium grande]
MARDQEQSSCSHAYGLEEEDEEDYIDMEVNMVMSTSSFSISPNSFSYTIPATSPPHQARDFEFQMSSSTACPADELFYKGKLLPLHLPPRLQMVQTLIQGQDPCEEKFPIFPSSASAPPTRTSTPLGSCNISPAQSCRVSCELSPADFDEDDHSSFFEWSNEVRGFINHDRPKKHNSRNWSKKLKQIKQSSLCQRIRTSSRAFLRSLFSKSGCSDESCAKASVVACNAEAEKLCREREPCSKYMRVENKKKKKKSNPFGENCINDGFKIKLASAIMKDIDGEYVESNGIVHRKSFSGAIQMHSGAKCTSSSSSSSSSSSLSSFSFNLNGLNEFQLLKRSSSANSELESWIEGAIAHCKRSQHTFV